MSVGIQTFSQSIPPEQPDMEESLLNKKNSSPSNTNPLDREEYRRKKDSIKANAKKTLVKFWKLRANGAYKSRYNNADTIGFNIQIVNPFYKKSIANSFVANTGGAYKSMIYVKQENELNFLFLQPYSCYLSRPETNLFIDTHTPYTDIKYLTGSRNNGDENILNILFSRNIKKGWNLGFKYNLISSNGQYPEQKQRNYNFSFFSSYEIGRYNVFAFISHNRLHSEENGGLKDDLVVERDTTITASNMEVNLIDTRTNFHNYNYFLSHNYNIGEKKIRTIDTDSIPIYPLKIIHTIHLDKNSRVYIDKEELGKFYAQAYYNISATEYERQTYENLKNSVQIVLNEKYFKWFKYGLRAELLQEHISYSMPDLSPVFPSGHQTINTKQGQNNMAFQGGAFYHSSDKIRWDAYWNMYFLGKRAGDTKTDFSYTHNFGTDSISQHRLHLKFMMENKTPDVFIEKFFSNRIRWSKNFDKESKLEIGGSYTFKNKKWEIELGGYYTLLKNYIYSGLSIAPEQHTNPISITTTFLQAKLQLWKLHLDPTIYIQQSSNQSVLPLPLVSLYANTYFESNLFKKAIKIRLGVDGRYFSKWNAPAYFPASGQFYLQNEKKIGDFPKIDVYLISRFKRASFFVKYEHVNIHFENKAYFTALHYPFNPNIIKYGVRWYFYD